MKRKGLGLTGKLMIGVVLLAVLMGTAVSLIGYREFTSVLEQQYNDSAYEIADTAVGYLNPDKFAQYLSSGETDEEYDEILKSLDALTAATNITFIYVAAVDSSDYRTLTYIYDAVNPDSGFSRYPFGYTAEDVSEAFVNDVKNIMTKGERAKEYLYTYSSESGAHTSAAVPVKDSEGNIVALLCVEKPMTRLESARNTYVRHVAIITVAAAALFLLTYSLFMNREILKPILAVTEEAKRFAETSVPSGELLPTGKKDEIGILSRAIGKMETDIETYVKNLTIVTAEKERIGAELDVAAHIQSSMLPCIFPAFPERKEVDIYATMNPAKEVGGDFYDFFMVDESHLAIVMADVSGKGVPAALFMVIAKTLLKDHTTPGADLGEVFMEVNELLCESNSEGMFVTVFEGVLDMKTGEFRYANAGHEIPFICKKGDTFKPYKIRAGFVLAGMEGMRYKSGSLTLEPGDRIFQYTDGVTEATNARKELFGMDRLEASLDTHKELDVMKILPAVKADIDAFVGEAEQFDDITMLCLEYRERMEGEQ